MRQSTVRDWFVSGIAAFDSWVAALLDDAAFEGASLESLRAWRREHDSAVGGVAEYGAYASHFIESAARESPQAADELGQAARCFRALNDLRRRA